MLIMFGWVLKNQATTMIALLGQPVHDGLRLLHIASTVLGTLFVALVVVMTVRRLPALKGPSGLEPRLTAIGGTFALMGLIALPPGQAPAAVLLLAITLMVVGFASSAYALYYLGRSFSIAPTARELITTGPYGLVRHPLYLAEAITTAGMILTHWSWGAVILAITQLALQYRRIYHEENILRAAFPDSYDAYARRVPQLVPGLRPAQAAAA
jgi:protein-S-isoprenylcysteine O-methyltransferase Ste14